MSHFYNNTFFYETEVKRYEGEKKGPNSPQLLRDLLFPALQLWDCGHKVVSHTAALPLLGIIVGLSVQQSHRLLFMSRNCNHAILLI